MKCVMVQAFWCAFATQLFILFCVLCAEPASADNWNCLEAWPPDMKTRPDFTCVPITERLLVSLEHATKAQVTKAMKADGRSVEVGLHFVSNAENYSGDVNFTFEGDEVVLIDAMVDTKAGPPMAFVWNPAYHGPLPSACSDLPGSRYDRCNKSVSTRRTSEVWQSGNLEQALQDYNAELDRCTSLALHR
jgi:hypothetical protein